MICSIELEDFGKLWEGEMNGIPLAGEVITISADRMSDSQRCGLMRRFSSSLDETDTLHLIVRTRIWLIKTDCDVVLFTELYKPLH